ncbi:MAG: vWA domain-containing protein [Myxococcota bacterium]
MRVLSCLVLLPACAGDLLVGGGHTVDGTASVFATLQDADSPVSLAPGVAIEVETAGPGTAWAPASGVVTATDVSPLDVVLAADNSGSVDWDTLSVRGALRDFAAGLLADDPRTRAGLVRISTEAELLLPPTADAAALDAALGELFVSNGWTALWDGLRIANEALDAAAVPASDQGCGARPQPTVVAVVDGVDNNSDDRHATDTYAGDGVDTDLESLLALRAGDTYTTVHVVELGPVPQEAPLRRLASATGGAHLEAVEREALATSLAEIRAVLSARAAVCFVPARCDDTRVRMVARWREGGRAHTATATARIPSSCG